MPHNPWLRLNEPVPVVIAIIFFVGISLIGMAVEVHSNGALAVGILIIAGGLYQTMKWLLIRDRK
jgi:hypothetical protein